MHLCWSMWKNCLVLRHLGWMFCSKSEEKLKCRWSDDWFAPKHHPQTKTKHMSKGNRPSWVAQWKLTSWLTGLWHFCHCCAFSAIWSGPRPFCNCIWYMRFVTLIATVFCKVLFTTYFFFQLWLPMSLFPNCPCKLLFDWTQMERFSRFVECSIYFGE